MTGYSLGERAWAHLAEIYRYSRTTWGDRQADEYIQDLFVAFDRISRGEARSRVIPDRLGVNGQRYRCRSHFIYWYTLPSGKAGIFAVVDQRRSQEPQVRSAFGAPF